LTAAARDRLSAERGFTLIETLIVASLLIVVLGAIASISDSTRSNANADQSRTDTLDIATAGLTRMVSDLRQACYLIAPGSAQSTSMFCGVAQTTVSASTATGTRTVTPDGGTTNGSESTACASTATPPTTSNNCIDFLMRGRTTVTRDPVSGAVTGTTRRLWRVRYNCAVSDPRDPARTSTLCERFAVQCTTVAGATTCLAPCSPSATGCAASTASTDNLITGSVTNSAVTDPALTPRPIFLYCARVDILTCSASFSGTSAAIRVDLAIARRGALATGLHNSVELKDVAELRNNVSDSASRDDAAGE
jgi:Tfp pilus assembly protein PilV